MLIKKVHASALRLGWSFLQGIKRGCNTVPDSYVGGSILDHAIAMTTPPTKSLKFSSGTFVDYTVEGPLDVFVPDTYDVSSSYKATKIVEPTMKDPFHIFERYLTRIFNKTQKLNMSKPQEASHKSSYQSNFAQGGAYGHIVSNYLGSDTEPTMHTEAVLSESGYSFNLTYGIPSIGTVQDYVRKLPHGFIGFTKVVPVLEPIKVRIITKGDAMNYYYAKNAQKSMKGYLDRFTFMTATTRPLISDDISQLLEREKRLNLPFTKWVSGDYKSATDKLNIGLTKMIFNSWMNITDLNIFDRNVLESVLFEQKLEYPPRFTDLLRRNDDIKRLDLTPNEKHVTLLQQNGQLMGSILSFPVLCVANLLCYWFALEEYMGLRYKLHELPVLVNGDDILFRANDEFYEIWLNTIKTAGFVLSTGKNYIHEDIFTINSQVYRFSNGEILEYGYLNVGLLTGQAKHGKMKEKLPLWDIYNKVMHLASDKVYAHSKFLHYHRSLVQQLSKQGNFQLFFPRELGGLGFDLYPGIVSDVTRFQFQLANTMARSFDNLNGKTSDDLLARTIRLVQTNTPKVSQPFMGKINIKVKPKWQPLEAGYTDAPISSDVLFSTPLGDIEPKLAYRFMDPKFLAEFRQSKVRTSKVNHYRKYLNDHNEFMYHYIYSYDYKSYVDRCSLALSSTLKNGLREDPSGGFVWLMPDPKSNIHESFCLPCTSMRYITHTPVFQSLTDDSVSDT